MVDGASTIDGRNFASMNRMRSRDGTPDEHFSSSGRSDEDHKSESKGDVSDDCGTEECGGEVEETDNRKAIAARRPAVAC